MASCHLLCHPTKNCHWLLFFFFTCIHAYSPQVVLADSSILPVWLLDYFWLLRVQGNEYIKLKMKDSIYFTKYEILLYSVCSSVDQVVMGLILLQDGNEVEKNVSQIPRWPSLNEVPGKRCEPRLWNWLAQPSMWSIPQ